jgi:hypothetical protein
MIIQRGGCVQNEGILALMIVAEGLFILWNRHSINRFKAVDADGYVAFYSATGQICRTFRTSGRGRRSNN